MIKQYEMKMQNMNDDELMDDNYILNIIFSTDIKSKDKNCN